MGEVVRNAQTFPAVQRAIVPPPKTNSTPEPLPPIRWPGTNGAVSAETLTKPRLASRRLIPVRLVNTVDSFSPETPIIGLVTEDVFFLGQLMIPKNTEVHARAQAGRFRDRIASQGSWTLVWPTGEELTVAGLALDRDYDGQRWGPTDGTYGLRGSLLRSDDFEELKLFFATFLAGMTEPFKERQTTVFGLQLAPTAENAALSGVGEVLQSYARRILENAERESLFVRVPSGRTFYLYTLEPIHPPETRTAFPAVASTQTTPTTSSNP